MKHICPLCKSEYEKTDLSEMTDEQKYLEFWTPTLGAEEAQKSWKQKQAMENQRIQTHYARGDIQGYISQIDGSWIESRSKHKEHLKRHGMVELGNDVPLKVAPKQHKDPKLTETIGRLVYDKLRYK